MINIIVVRGCRFESGLWIFPEIDSLKTKGHGRKAEHNFQK